MEKEKKTEGTVLELELPFAFGEMQTSSVS